MELQLKLTQLQLINTKLESLTFQAMILHRDRQVLMKEVEALKAAPEAEAPVVAAEG